MGRRFMVLLMGVAVVLASCSKDSVSVNKLSAKIEGKSWNASLRVANLSSNVFVITGTSLTGEVLVLTIMGDKPGLYEFSVTDYKCNATYKKSALSTSSDDVFTSVSGRVNLTKVDLVNKKISGTFDFTLARLSLETVSVSNGSFNDLEFTNTSI
jgi:hypothetical protein